MATFDDRMTGTRNRMSTRCKGFVTAACLMVAACSTDGGPFEGMFGDPPLPPKCPSVRILQEAASVTVFTDGPGRDLTDVIAEGKIEDFFARCLYDVDDETGEGEVAVELSVTIEAARGPANTEGEAVFPYFVSITDKDRTVLNKSVFGLDVRFAKNAFRVLRQDEPILLRIPLSPPQKGDQFSIYIGLQLTPEQLEYNKRNLPALLDG